MARIVLVLAFVISGATMAAAVGVDDIEVKAPTTVGAVVAVASADVVLLNNECSQDADCKDPSKPHCCCGLTATGVTMCACRASCP